MNTKQTEALKLAQDLRALADRFSEGWHEGIKIDALDIELLANAAESLAEQPAQSSKPFDTHTAPGQSFDTHSRTTQQEPSRRKGAHWTEDYPDSPMLDDFPTAQQEHKAAANAALRDAQNRSYQVAKSTQPAQPRKPWVGLGPGEISKIATSDPLAWANLNTVENRQYFARAIEAKLREKNA